MSSVIRGDDNIDSADLESGRAKAWVYFNGTGTVAIKRSFNVTSITDLGTGSYTVNLTNALPNVDCSVVASGNSSSNWTNSVAVKARTTTALTLTATQADANADLNYIDVAVFN